MKQKQHKAISATKLLWKFLCICFVTNMLMLVSCTHNDIFPDKQDARPVSVTVDFSMPKMDIKTRALLSEASENVINNVYLFICNAEGKIVHRTLKKYDMQNVDVRKAIIEGHNLFTGLYRFYAIANVDDAETLFNISKPDLDNIADETALKNTILAYSNEMETTSRISGKLLMTGVTEKTITVPISGNAVVDVPLKRLVASVTFNIKAAEGITFRPHEYQVMRIPKKILFFEDVNAAPSDNADDYFDASPGYLEADGNTFSYYQFENLSRAANLIDAATEKPYKQRAKQRKAPLAGAVTNPVVTNGEFVNAPSNGTYVILTGDFTKKNADGTTTTAHTRYFLHLGYLNDGTPGVTAVNDYATHRNTRYTYNVTITDVNDIILEATSDNESDSRAEGEVFRSHDDYYLDAHYETVLWTLNKSDFFTADGSAKPLNFSVNTPFGGLKFNDEAKDIKWLKFAFNHISGTDYDYSGFKSYAIALQNTNNLFTFPELLNAIRTKQYNFDAAGKMAVTVYINEYYYEKDPTLGDNAPIDVTLWKRFVNRPDRHFHVYPVRNISTDGNSIYSQPILSIRQRSIKTFYNPQSDYTSGWGIETVTEGSQQLKYADMLSPLTIRNDPMNISYFHGRYNTLREFAGHVWWGDHTGLDRRNLSDALNPKDNTLIGRFRFARYACLTRNRDLNGNNRIDADEVRWYMPAITQLLETWIMNEAMPHEGRLFKGKYEKLSFVSSTAYTTGSNANNPYTLWAQAGSIYTALNEASINNGASGFAPSYRCIRNFGIPQNPDEKYPPATPNITTVPNIPIPEPFYSSLDQSSSVLDFSRCHPQAIRSRGEFLSKGEMPAHTHIDPQNKLYSKVKIAKNWAKESETSNNDWRNSSEELAKKLTNGPAPCSYYTEEPDKSDKGKWRTPNERELALILVRAYSPGGTEDTEHFWSATRFAWPSQQFNNPSGYFLYQKGQYYNSTNIPGGTFFVVNGTYGRIRCVRDIE